MICLSVLALLLLNISSVHALYVPVPDPICETSIPGNCVDSTPVSTETSSQSGQGVTGDHNSEDIGIFKKNFSSLWNSFVAKIQNTIKMIQARMQAKLESKNRGPPAGAIRG